MMKINQAPISIPTLTMTMQVFSDGSIKVIPLRDNCTAAESMIRDTDMADETEDSEGVLSLLQ